MRSRNLTPPPSSAFTLLELMVVITLLGILAAVTIPQFWGTRQAVFLRGAGRELATAINLASSQAVTLGRLHRLRLDTAAGRYMLEAPQEGEEGGTDFVPCATLPGGRGELEGGLAMEVRRPGERPSRRMGAAAASPAEAMEVLRFQPDGTTDAAEILLRDGEGHGLALRLDPVTSRVRVKSFVGEAP